MASKLSSALIVFAILLIGGAVIEFWLESGLWSWIVLGGIAAAITTVLQRTRE